VQTQEIAARRLSLGTLYLDPPPVPKSGADELCAQSRSTGCRTSIGITIVLLGYFLFPLHPIQLPVDQSALVVAAFTLIAWLLGTFVDALRNAVVEHLLDLLPPLKIRWGFFIHGEQEKITRVEEYFFSFYRIDMDMAVAITLFLTLSTRVFSAFVQQSVGYYPPKVGLILWIVTLIFIWDALSLRYEVKKYINENPSQF
jgi:hypothetical protein